MDNRHLPDDPAADVKLDEMGEETFPASDPPGNTVETGIALGLDEGESRVVDKRDKGRLELDREGEVSFLNYRRNDNAFVIVHTEVPPPLRGHGLGEALVRAAVGIAQAEGLRVVPVCPFARAYLHKHPTLR